MKMKQPEDEPIGLTKIHNVRFYNLTPRAIQVLAYNKIFHKLAVARNDSSLEIWDVKHAPYLEKSFPFAPGRSIEGMVWSGQRLFTVGLNGELVEWDLLTLQPMRKQFVTGNAAWCIDVDSLGANLSVGTEEGYVNIFDLENDQMQYKQLFDKQEGRILCCKFDATGEFLVTGSICTIRIWNVKSGHALHKMTVARSEQRVDVIVWSLQVLSDFTIVAGDSRGYLTVWDGRAATQLESYLAQKADVLAVAVNEEENLLMCAGVEPIIRIYAKTEIKREDMRYNRWVKYLQRAVHDHDVKALVCSGERIFSGGVDGYLGLSMMTKTNSKIVKFGPFLQNPCVTVSPENKLVLFRYTNYLELWRLGAAVIRRESDKSIDCEVKANENSTLPLERPPEKLLQLKSKDDEPILCSTISPNGRLLCYSTLLETRLFHFKPGKCKDNNGMTEPSQLIRLSGLSEQMKLCENHGGATHLQFTSDSKRLYVVHGVYRQIILFDILAGKNGDFAISFVKCYEAGKKIKDNITAFIVSECGTYIVAASAGDRTIAVWRMLKDKLKHMFNLPRYAAAPTAIAIHSNLPLLVAAFADGKIFEYDLEKCVFTCSDHNTFSETHCTTSILLDIRNPSVFILQSDTNFIVLEKYTDSEEIKKRRSQNLLEDEEVKTKLRLKMEKSFDHLIHLSWLNSQELVAVGVNPISIIEQLPPVFKQKTFGTA